MTLQDCLNNHLKYFFVKKCWNDTKVFLHERKKNNKIFCGKQILMCLEASMGRLKTNQNFFWSNFYSFFSSIMKKYCLSFQDFSFNNLPILCYCKARNNHGDEWLLLDEHPRNRFYMLKNSKGQTKQKIFQKQYS